MSTVIICTAAVIFSFLAGVCFGWGASEMNYGKPKDSKEKE